MFEGYTIKNKILLKLTNSKNCQYFHKYKGYGFSAKVVASVTEQVPINHLGVVIDYKQIDAKCTMSTHKNDLQQDKIGIWVVSMQEYEYHRIIYENTHTKTKKGDDIQYIIPNFFEIANKIV